MLPDYARNVPPAIHGAVTSLLKEAERLHDNCGVAYSARRVHLQRARADLADCETELMDAAVSAFEWAVGVRAQLPLARIRETLESSLTLDPTGPYVTFFSDQTDYPELPNAPGGKLSIKLELSLHPDSSWFIRRTEWFDGHLIHGGDQLDSALKLQAELSPKALLELHKNIAEGDVWKTINLSLKKLARQLMDG